MGGGGAGGFIEEVFGVQDLGTVHNIVVGASGGDYWIKGGDSSIGDIVAYGGGASQNPNGASGAGGSGNTPG